MVVPTAPAAAAELTTPAGIVLGAPALSDAPDNPAPAPTPTHVETGPRWRPLPITQELDPADPLDSRIIRILDGAEADHGQAWVATVLVPKGRQASFSGRG
ncbi:hypothetical protein ACF1G0_32860 [Streptomyces sp. NPDC013953]|uniref:hypothetical protein n=1 Tax=Streptomyces sp. NPDC013953 TaxID=3364868 RepID=UPI0036FCDD9F